MPRRFRSGRLDRRRSRKRNEACAGGLLGNSRRVRTIGPVRSFLGGIEGLFDRMLCVLAAALFSQFPEFIQQYLQRLGGHLDEAQRQLDQFRGVAAHSNLTLGQFIANTENSAEPTVAQLGQVMHATVQRVHDLAAAETAIRDASMFMRPVEFLRHMDFSIVRATWAMFKPAVPTTIEGLAYAAMGVLVVLVIYHGGVRYPVRRAWRRRSERRQRAVAAPAEDTGSPEPPGDPTA